MDDLIAEAVEGLRHLAGKIIFLNQQTDASMAVVVIDARVQLLGLGLRLLVALQQRAQLCARAAEAGEGCCVRGSGVQPRLGLLLQLPGHAAQLAVTEGAGRAGQFVQAVAQASQGGRVGLQLGAQVVQGVQFVVESLSKACLEGGQLRLQLWGIRHAAAPRSRVSAQIVSSGRRA